MAVAVKREEEEEEGVTGRAGVGRLLLLVAGQLLRHRSSRSGH